MLAVSQYVNNATRMAGQFWRELGTLNKVEIASFASGVFMMSMYSFVPKGGTASWMFEKLAQTSFGVTMLATFFSYVPDLQNRFFPLDRARIEPTHLGG